MSDPKRIKVQCPNCKQWREINYSGYKMRTAWGAPPGICHKCSASRNTIKINSYKNKVRTKTLDDL